MWLRRKIEAEPLRIIVTLISWVEGEGRHFCFRLGAVPVVRMVETHTHTHTHTHTQRPGSSSCPWFSASLRGQSEKEKKTEIQCTGLWTRLGLQPEPVIFPQCVLNCGGSGIAPWWCGEVELLGDVRNTLVAELRFWWASGGLLVPQGTFLLVWLGAKWKHSCYWHRDSCVPKIGDT